MTVVGLLHPGAMGASVGAACDAEVIWCADGRSAATAERAASAGLRSVDSLARVVREAEIIVSVCPPGEATAVARSVAALGFGGIYVDANAVAPATARDIAASFDRFVDGGIVGPPATRVGTTRIYLSGADAGAVASLWADGILEPRVLDGGAGSASALKMTYAAWTKVSAALLLDVRALARAEGVEDSLLGEWELSQPGTAERSALTAAGVVPKAWRFVGEMQEITRSFADADLPSGFGSAAAELYQRLAGCRDMSGADIESALAALLGG